MRYRRVPNRARVSGSEVATRLLGEHGLQRVRVEQTPGALSDHYDGTAGALRLSEPVATERSVAAMGIAAHEVSHAYQDADGNRAYRIRKAVAEPLAKFAPFSALFFIGGFWLGIPVLMALSLLYVFGLVVFALAALVCGTAVAADKTHEGTVVSAAGGKLVMVDKDGKNEHTHTIGATAKISLDGKANLSLLDSEELGLVKLAAQYPRVIEGAALAHEPHRVAFYLYDLAAAFHALWNRGNDDPDRRFLIENNPQLSRSRLELAAGIGQIIKNGLGLMGVEAAEEMR